jgi:hypothetical protein
LPILPNARWYSPLNNRHRAFGILALLVLTETQLTNLLRE